MKEREKIYIAADLVQKNYLELRKQKPDVNLDQMVDVFIEKGQRLNPNIEQIVRESRSENSANST